jgi:endonuclease-3 related protein
MFVAFLDARYSGSLQQMFAQPTPALRQELLALNGVGPETADSILLYAGDHPVFVVDAYTRRILERHEILPAKTDYEDIRSLFERALCEFQAPHSELEAAGDSATRLTAKTAWGTSLPGAAHAPSPVSAATRPGVAQRYNEMHALIVGVGKRYCAKREPRCQDCPLQPFLLSRRRDHA